LYPKQLLAKYSLVLARLKNQILNPKLRIEPDPELIEVSNRIVKEQI